MSRTNHQAVTPVAETSLGELAGQIDGGAVVFRGVPYALPPDGERRWCKTLPPASWRGVRDATRFAPIPPQLLELRAARPGVAMSEDCLYLNIWTPAVDDRRRPVLVYIHGGGLRSGSGSSRTYNGARLAARGDVVVVTLNYRLGGLANIYLPELLGAENVNLFLYDQAAAFSWIRREIAAFGGDPQNITAIGHSSGAVALACLSVSPLFCQLFDKMILQSGGLRRINSHDEAQISASRFLNALPATGSALRMLPLSAILSAQGAVISNSSTTPPGSDFHPIMGGVSLPMPPINAAERGLSAAIPLLVGTTMDEWSAYDAPLPPQHFSEELLQVRTKAYYPDVPSSELLSRQIQDRLEESGRASDRKSVASALLTEAHFRAPSYQFASAHAATGHRTFHYILDWADSGRGSPHGICQRLLFGNYRPDRVADPTGESASLSQQVQNAWVSFARHGDPSGNALGHWPTFHPGEASTMSLGPAAAIIRSPCPLL
ncbi:MAG TPA: carboxylesterase family protein [Steroidobacteraceae bacterium]|jgi:para-nitrobenzyl esterase